tara:strand:- start:927 stop:1922 length:996 start_codon:yes stop_codon:yes gene_type:complete
MNFSLIICTYQRPIAILSLLNSVRKQTLYPNQIIVVDSSKEPDTQHLSLASTFRNLEYFKVNDKDRGLTKQRNYGISKLVKEAEVVCFLDDDVILEKWYFENLLSTYSVFPKALGVGGYITNEVNWIKQDGDQFKTQGKFYFDSYWREDGSRFVLRKKLGLDTNEPPAFFPDFGHGRSVSFLPPSGKIYEVEQFMGGVSSFKKEVFDNHTFSTYFEGYGLYEDADFTLRLSKMGKLYVNTTARLEHHHNSLGRPNSFKYGKMVLRNGWYVWRIKFPKPNLKSRLKWNATAFLLTLIRFSNALTTPSKKEAFLEASGRVVGWLSLIFSKPRS